jgi:AcrR family transcriptional regulator
VAQYRPDAATLLAAIAEVLDDVLDDVAVDKRHRVRVAANLTRIVAREAALGPTATEDEMAALHDLVGATGSVDEAGDRLAQRLRDGVDDEFADAVWAALVEITGRDLDIAKPGHSEWTGG